MLSDVSCLAGSLAWGVSDISPSILVLQTDKEDELSRRIKRVLGDYDPRKIPIYYTLLDPIWIPKNPKSDSQAHSHRPASSKTNPYKDIRRESSRESLGIAPNPEQNYNDSNKGLSNRRSEAKAPQSEILPELVKVSSVVGVLCYWQSLKAKGPAHRPCLVGGSAPSEVEGTWFPGVLWGFARLLHHHWDVAVPYRMQEPTVLSHGSWSRRAMEVVFKLCLVFGRRRKSWRLQSAFTGKGC